MSSDLARFLLVVVAVGLQFRAGSLANRDRDRRERETGIRPQPLRYSTAGMVMLGLSLVAVAGAAITLFV